MRARFAQLCLVAGLAASGLVVPAPAHATGTVTMYFAVSIGVYVPGRGCEMTVPEGTSGLDVMDAAVDQGCIRSYATVPTSQGNYVTCINRFCERYPALFWLMYENGELADHGVDDFVADDDGDELAWVYV